PWLVDEPLVEVAAQRHLDAGLRWDDWDLLRRAEELPILRTFVEERARRTEDDHELSAILDGLRRQGVPRRRWLAPLRERLESRPPTHRIAETVAHVLSTRTAWEEDGGVFLHALMGWRDWHALGALWTMFTRLGPGPESRKLLAAVHLAFARV